MRPNETVYLRHILDAIARVEIYLQDVDEEIFDENNLLQDGVIRQIEIIGEATRHKLIHDYFGVDVAKVWLTAVDDLPVLKTEVAQILSSLLAAQERNDE